MSHKTRFSQQVQPINNMPNGVGSPPSSFQLSVVNMNDADLPDPAPMNHPTNHKFENNNTWDKHVKKVNKKNQGNFSANHYNKKGYSS